MRILQFINEKNCPSREMLLDSLRLGEPIVLQDLDPSYPGSYIAFSVERLRYTGKNSEWFVNFKNPYDNRSCLMYLSTHTKKAFTVNQRFNFPKNGENLKRSLSHNEVELLCHMTEFKCYELNDRIINCFIDSATFNQKDSAVFEQIEMLRSMKSFKKKAKLLIPIVQQLVR